MSESEKSALTLKIVTPLGVLFEGAADMIIMRAQDGDIGVLPDHEPFTAALGYGVVRAFADDDETVFSVLGGLAEVSEDHVVVLSDAAERQDQIDADRALAAKERAEAMLRQQSDAVDIKKASLALRRALVRIEASSYPLIGGRGMRK
ncbi:MAG: ATP synthase F1 subunit epsilon [Clostridiales bacterium]|jgi:F-type H+-transporting ATPase subunit epsilon|nr:ATP synthase F1 subunit epsilon [Clostridiales bacterium]